MRYLIVGGVAAGTKVAAKLKRCDRSAEVTVITKSEDISYAGCGLPYYIGGDIKTRGELIVNTPAAYEGLTGVEVRTGVEATALDAAAHEVTVREKDGSEHGEKYDKLVIATGASPFVPAGLPGADLSGVFTVRTPDDAEAIRAYADAGARRAVVVGAGFIGLEVAENLLARGLSVTVIDAMPQILPNVFDPEMAGFAQRQLKAAGVRVMTSCPLKGITGDQKVTGVETGAGTLPADLVILSIGIRPNTAWLEGSGLELDRGCVVVNELGATNLPDVYAAGDCAEVTNALTGKPMWSAMGSTANIAGRAIARTLTGTPTPYPGALGTGVVRLLSTLNGGRTGLTEAAAREAGFDPVSVVSVADDKAHYYPGSSSFMVKLVADRASHRLLGVQVLGAGAVDKVVDVVVTALYQKARVEDLGHTSWRTSSRASSRASRRPSTPPAPPRTTTSSTCCPPPRFPARSGWTSPRSARTGCPVTRRTRSSCWCAPRASAATLRRTASRPRATRRRACSREARRSTRFACRARRARSCPRPRSSASRALAACRTSALTTSSTSA